MPIDDADLEFDLFRTPPSRIAEGDADRRIADEDNLRDGHRGGLSRSQQARRRAAEKARR